MNERVLTPALEDAILEDTELRDSLEDKRLMAKYHVGRTTLYRARWRALRRRREEADARAVQAVTEADESNQLVSNVPGAA